MRLDCLGDEAKPWIEAQPSDPDVGSTMTQLLERVNER